MSAFPAADIHAAWRSLLADDIDRAGKAMAGLGEAVWTLRRRVEHAVQQERRRLRIKRMHAMYRRRQR